MEQPSPYSREVLRSLRASVMGAIADLEARRSQGLRDRWNEGLAPLAMRSARV